MKRVAAMRICLFLSLGLMVSLAVASDCTKCDCIHLPCPKECKPCCGFKIGTILSKNDSMLTMNGEKFTIMSDTKISGHLTEGSRAEVYFRMSGEEKQATKIVMLHKDGTGPERKD